MPDIELILLIVGVLLLATVLAAKLSERLRVPSLLLFLLVGMLAGSEGPGGIEFDSPEVAQSVGTVALAVILFSGGLDTDWRTIRPVLAPGLVLATVGVLLTATVVGAAAWLLLGSYTDFSFGPDGLGWSEALLLGVIVASTDAAALFAMFRGAGPQPKRRIRSVLELESGTNDPVAVIFTTAILGLLTSGSQSAGAVLGDLAVQMVLGTLAGLALGWLGAEVANRIGLETLGLYPILVLSFGLITFGLSEVVGANPFLAVYLAGVLIGNRLTQQRSLVLDATDAFAWLAQIVMFLALGLLVFPSELPAIAPVSLALAAVLILVARPVAIFACLAPFRFGARGMTYISWAGLKGAVPIVLATFPATFGLGAARDIFNVVFFLVVVSVLVQGLTLPGAARRLEVTEPD